MEKKCTKCGSVKPIEQFHKDKRRSDGHTSSCGECRTKHTVKWSRENEAWKRDSNKACNKRRMEKLENKQKASHASTKWQRNNPDKSVPYNRANAAIRRVMDKFPEALVCELSDTLDVYEEAYIMEKSTGVKYCVDHVVPLVAGGLHHPSNLVAISEDDHKAKTNKEFNLMRQLMRQHYEAKR